MFTIDEIEISLPIINRPTTVCSTVVLKVGGAQALQGGAGHQQKKKIRK